MEKTEAAGFFSLSRFLAQIRKAMHDFRQFFLLSSSSAVTFRCVRRLRKVKGEHKNDPNVMERVP